MTSVTRMAPCSLTWPLNVVWQLTGIAPFFMASLPLAENAPAGATVTSALATPAHAQATTTPAMMFLIIIVIP